MSAHKLLLPVLITALALRAVAAVVVTTQLENRGDTFLIAGDAAGYWELGQHIADREPYELHGQADGQGLDSPPGITNARLSSPAGARDPFLWQ
jgi:hypothetical protein